MENRTKTFTELHNESLEETDPPSFIINRVGQKYGRLTITSYIKTKGNNYSRLYHRWKVKCDCGKIIVVDTQHFRKMRDCGCGLDE